VPWAHNQQQRHLAGDSGDLDEDDRRENEFSLEQGFRLKNGERVWVITEADRSSTCILLPEEH
jgi:hypothetical protein